MKENNIGYRNLRNQREYLKMITANVVNRFGDAVDAIAFTWMVYAITGSAAWSAIIFGMNHIPTIFIQPFVGALVEGMKKKQLMIWTDIARGMIVTGLALLYGMNLITPWVLLSFTILISTVEAFRIPAGTSFIPKILEREYYEVGTGMNNTACMVVELIGTGAAGAIIGIFGIKAAILIDAVTFFLSAMIIAAIHYKEKKQQKQRIDIAGYMDTLNAGIRYIKGKKIVINFCILGFLLNALITPFNSLLTPIVVELWHKSSEFLGVMGVALSLGMGIGSFFYPFLSKKNSVDNQVYISGFLTGMFYLIFPLAGRFTDYGVVVTAMAVMGALGLGMSASVLTSALHVQFMKEVEEEYLARAGSVFNATATAAIPVMSLLISGLVAVFPIKWIMIVCGSLSVVLFICMKIGKMHFSQEG